MVIILTFFDSNSKITDLKSSSVAKFYFKEQKEIIIQFRIYLIYSKEDKHVWYNFAFSLHINLYYKYIINNLT